MRDSMCFFLQLEDAVEGQNGFDPQEVLQVVDMLHSCCCCFHSALAVKLHDLLLWQLFTWPPGCVSVCECVCGGVGVFVCE